MPAQKALESQEFLACNNTVIAPPSLYSPDLAPCNFFLIPKMKFGPWEVAVDPGFRSKVKLQMSGHKNMYDPGADDDQAV